MFNNIALDIFIGLVFVFLLYSLFASAIGEAVAMLFAYRHRMLEKAIEQMLDGKGFSYYWWDKLGNYFLWVYYGIRRGTNNRFLANKRGKMGKAKRRDFFSTQSVTNTTNGIAPLKIKRITLNKKAALFAANIINHPLYRRKASDNLLYKKPAYISTSAFSDILVDVLSNRKSTTSSVPVLMNDIKDFVNSELGNNPDLKSILNVYIQQANGDIQKFKLLIESWFDETMDRVSGWYKRQATRVIFFIGFILAMSLNVNTIDIVHKLSVNKDLREAMAQSATEYVNENKDGNFSTTKPPNQDSLNVAIKEQIAYTKNLFDSSIAPVNAMMGMGWEYPKSVTSHISRIKYIICKTGKKPRNLLGFLITAIAITMGAPFWFDMLSKLVSLRGAGNKPAQDSGKPSSGSNTDKRNQNPAVNSFG